ncbi:hypothetical protein [Chryseobacterium soli]|uniref:hypothetical protein n=1 Tax=Chryseobacterium soli TaxID=445961 RepID=UPI0013F3BA4A|nr:hypothetical protein [Chryseobacterium soli]
MSSNAQNLNSRFEVSFQDNFKGDIVSLKLGKCGLLKNKILTSREIGFAGIIITFFEPNKISVSENGEIILEKKCNINLKKDIKFSLKLNNRKEILRINLNNGKYIGLNKDKDTFELRQLTVPFEYE